jgi:beta-N-acetylhexosaminidase
MKRPLTTLLSVISCILTAGAFCYRIPLFASVRSPLLATLAAASLILAVILSWLIFRFQSGIRILWGIAGLAPLLSLGLAEGSFRWRKCAVEQAPRELIEIYAPHFIVGYWTEKQAIDIVSRGLVGGIYMRGVNERNKSILEIAEQNARLREIAADAGVERLLIATDQEGGIVSRLTPPVARQPTLGAAADGLEGSELNGRVMEYARMQGEQLRACGVNYNFAPVVDLKQHRAGLDLYSRIYERAVSEDPERTALVSGIYCETLNGMGIATTLKHFPGLGSVNEDTHFFPGTNRRTFRELQDIDWVPYRSVLGRPRAEAATVMVSHVVVEALDPGVSSSVSRVVVRGIIRDQWKFDGVCITDDFSMLPIYRRGVGKSAVRALENGMDLILISYDPDCYYVAMYHLLRMHERGVIGGDSFAGSRERIVKLLRALYNRQ